MGIFKIVIVAVIFIVCIDGQTTKKPVPTTKKQSVTIATTKATTKPGVLITTKATPTTKPTTKAPIKPIVTSSTAKPAITSPLPLNRFLTRFLPPIQMEEDVTQTTSTAKPLPTVMSDISMEKVSSHEDKDDSTLKKNGNGKGRENKKGNNKNGEKHKNKNKNNDEKNTGNE